MTATREFAITLDPSAYDEDEIIMTIAPGYDTGNDRINYTGAGISPAYTSKFKSVRINSFSLSGNRNPIIEEAIDQVAAATVYAGTYSSSGQFEANFRGYDFATGGLLMCAMGSQTPSVVSSNGDHGAGLKYVLTMVPAPLAIKVVDEQATDTTGLNDVHGATLVYRGVGITSMDINFAVKEFAKSSFQWIARRAEAFDVPYNTAAPLNTIYGEPTVFYNQQIKWTPTGGSEEILKCKGFTMTISRKMDEDYFYIGSQFLQGLYYNGLTDLGGQITLGAGDWQRVRTMLTGATTTGDNLLDEDNKEFTGTAAAGTVNANAIPTGKFVIMMHTPNGVKEDTKITCDVANLVEMTESGQGRNMLEKTVTWKAQINETDTFSVEVYNNA